MGLYPVEIRENPEFHDLMREEKAHWPRCLFWHGWLPMLSGVEGASPWAADASESALHLVEAALGHYSSGSVTEGSLPAARMPDAPEVWTDGSLVLDQVTGFFCCWCWFLCSPVGALLERPQMGPC